MRFVQWLCGLAVITVCGVGTVWLLLPGEADRLRREKEDLVRQQIELQKVVERLTGEDRVAEVHVVDQTPGKGTQLPTTTIQFIELDRQQHPLAAREFVIEDGIIFFDALVIKFDQEWVARGDALRGKSLALFRRIYGEHQNPANGFPIDPQGDVPSIYRLDPKPSEFEKKLWSQFWDYAAQPDLAAKDGVSVAQGEAVYSPSPMKKGQVWSITLQNNGGLSLRLRR